MLTSLSWGKQVNDNVYLYETRQGIPLARPGLGEGRGEYSVSSSALKSFPCGIPTLESRHTLFLTEGVCPSYRRVCCAFSLNAVVKAKAFAWRVARRATGCGAAQQPRANKPEKADLTHAFMSACGCRGIRFCRAFWIVALNPASTAGCVASRARVPEIALTVHPQRKLRW